MATAVEEVNNNIELPEVPEPVIDPSLNYSWDELSSATPINFVNVNPTTSVTTANNNSTTLITYDLPYGYISLAESVLRLKMTAANATGAAASPYVNLKTSPIRQLRVMIQGLSDYLFDLNDMQAYWACARDLVPEHRVNQVVGLGAGVFRIGLVSGAGVSGIAQGTGTMVAGVPSGGAAQGTVAQAPSQTLDAGTAAATNVNEVGFSDSAAGQFAIGPVATAAVFYIELAFKDLVHSILSTKQLLPLWNQRMTIQVYLEPTDSWAYAVTLANPIADFTAGAASLGNLTINSAVLQLASESAASEKYKKALEYFRNGGKFSILHAKPALSQYALANTSHNWAHTYTLNAGNGNLLFCYNTVIKNNTLPYICRNLNASITAPAMSTCGALINNCRIQINSDFRTPSKLSIADRFNTVSSCLNSAEAPAAFVRAGAPYLDNYANVDIRMFDSNKEVSGYPLAAVGSGGVIYVWTDCDNAVGWDGSGAASADGATAARTSYILAFQQRILEISKDSVGFALP